MAVYYVRGLTRLLFVKNLQRRLMYGQLRLDSDLPQTAYHCMLHQCPIPKSHPSMLITKEKSVKKTPSSTPDRRPFSVC